MDRGWGGERRRKNQRGEEEEEEEGGTSGRECCARGRAPPRRPFPQGEGKGRWWGGGRGVGGAALPALPSFVCGACSAQHGLAHEGAAGRAAPLLTFPPAAAPTTTTTTTSFLFFSFLLPSPCCCWCCRPPPFRSFGRSSRSASAARPPPPLTEALPRSPPAFIAAWAGLATPPGHAATPPRDGLPAPPLGRRAAPR